MQEYTKKRNFLRTPEPALVKYTGEGPLTFVIQKHASRHLHYDLRLEMDGVLKSWALPHGPSLNPAEKRLAVMVEDHPFDYGSFEGVIPKGEYGAGQVIIWDKGTYSPERFDKFYFDDRSQAQKFALEGIEKGKLKFYLRGQKLQGIWTLVKMQNRGKNNWLLIKHQDEFAGSNRDVLIDESAVNSEMPAVAMKPEHLPDGKYTGRLKLDEIQGVKKDAFPDKIEPMLASLAKTPFTDPAWIFEPKLDGYRTIALIKDGKARLLSRHGLDITGEYPSLKESLVKQPVNEIVLDGEIIAIDKYGKLCFQCLQNYLSTFRGADIRREPVPSSIMYYVFDIIYLDSYNLAGVTLEERRKLLENTLRIDNQVRLIEQFSGDGDTIYQAAIDTGMEGVIAKRLESIYEPGRRSNDWLKIKSSLSDEFVIGGYTLGQGNRKDTFGALLLGQFNDKNKLIYSGRVGTGFDENTLRHLLKSLKKLVIKNCPFVKVPHLNALTVWVKPKIVVEVSYFQRTDDGVLRMPIFLRIRDDKYIKEIHLAQTTDSPSIQKTNQIKSTDPEPVNLQLLEQINKPVDKMRIIIDGHSMDLNNLDKILWPATDKHGPYTKRDLLAYLIRVSNYLLPHLKARPLSFNRFPNGINNRHFFQKHWKYPLPAFVETVPITTEHEGTKDYMVCNNLGTLIWLGQIADIELHTWFSRTTGELDKPSAANSKFDTAVGFPDFIVFDLDPYIYSGREKGGTEPELNKEAFTKVCEVAIWTKEVLDNISLTAFVKTSGKTGLHIYVPIKRQLGFDEVRFIAKTICLSINQKHPKETTIEWSVEKRTGKVFLDFNQNSFGKTLASVYSPRPDPEASVSTPLNWNELGKVYPTDFTIKKNRRYLGRYYEGKKRLKETKSPDWNSGRIAVGIYLKSQRRSGNLS